MNSARVFQARSIVTRVNYNSLRSDDSENVATIPSRSKNGRLLRVPRVLMTAIFQKLARGIREMPCGMTRAALPRSTRAERRSRSAREKSENLFDSIKANLSPSRDKFSRIKSWNMIRLCGAQRPRAPLCTRIFNTAWLRPRWNVRARKWKR